MELSRLKFVGFWDRNKREKRKSLPAEFMFCSDEISQVILVKIVWFIPYVMFWENFFGFQSEWDYYWAIPERKKKQGAWGFGIPRCIKEIASGVSRG